MRRFKNIFLSLIGLSLVCGVVYFFILLPPKFDRQTNAVKTHAPYAVSERAKQLHQGLRVADLHADTLLWKRNPGKKHDYGHTDFPRLREGGVALQVFSTVTKVPSGRNQNANPATSDRMGLLALAHTWPPSTWFSIYERAAHQAHRLQKLEKTSAGKFVIARNQTDLLDALKARETNIDVLIGILATEGAHPLEGDLANIDRLYDEGFRVIGLQHFFDNELGGSLHGVTKGGLTNFGQNAVKAIIDKGMILDLAHSSINVAEDVLAMTDAPLLVSHTGILSLCNNPSRNLPDRIMGEIAERGGVIGIGYWEMAVCDTTPDGIAKMLIHGANQFGVDHIALGSDFDGTIKTDFDTSELVALTDALLRQGMTENDIAKVMGENLISYFTRNLPE